MWIRKYPYCEAAPDEGGAPDGVSGTHPATGSGGEDGGDGAAAGAGDTGKPDGLMSKASGEGGTDEGGSPGEPGPDGRPADIPEQFWTAPGEGEETGKLNTEALVKSWKDTRKELTEVKGNFESKAPEKADDYKFTPPTETEIPYEALSEDDTGMAAIKIAAKAAGLDQGQYQKLVETFFENCADAIPAPFDEAAELAIVGKNGQAVVDANVRWCADLMERGVISKDEYEEAMLMGATGYGVRFLAKVRAEATGEQPIPLDAVHVDGALPSKEELYKMQGDPKYANDPKFRADVDRKFDQVYGNAPAGSSEQNTGISHTSTPPANIRKADAMRKAQGA